MIRPLCGVVAFALLLLATELQAADLVEFVSGRKLTGTVVTIRKEKKDFDFRYQIAGREFTKTYRFAEVHAVTMKGKRYELTPKSSAPTKTTASSDSTDTSGNARRRRTKAEIQRMIQAAGETPPDWFATTKLDYPPTLDLSWPLKPPNKGWKNQVNIGQYLWDITNPNPNRWRSGIKLVHHCLTLHKGKPDLIKRDQTTLGRMYFNLLQDYPRAAYWLEKAGVGMPQPGGVMLAECYWRMGNRQMAEDMLRSRTLPLNAIKLMGAMGKVKEAVKMAQHPSLRGAQKNDAYMLAADALRADGQTRQAIAMYQQIVDSNDFRNKDYEKRHKSRARDSIAALQLADKADVKRVADGSYTGDAIGYNGRMSVEVIVKGNKIVSNRVTRHNEKQFYSAINDTTRQIMDRQGVTGIDATTGATITAQAIVNAAAKALANGAR